MNIANEFEVILVIEIDLKVDQFPESIFNVGSYLGEGPLWSQEKQRLYWIDIHGKIIHVFDPATKCGTTYPTPDLVTAIALQKNKNLLLALRHQIASLDFQTAEITLLHTLNNDPSIRFNDGKCDCMGRFWTGTINTAQPTSNACTLYSFDGKILKPVLQDIVFSNGLAWSPNNDIFFHVESFRKAIFAYDFNTENGSFANKRLFVSLQETPAFPDGITIDEEGGVWCAHYGESKVVRYDKMGKISDIIKLPTPHVTNCAFGGKNLDTLYITTARENLSPAQLQAYPFSGNLFAIKVNYKGMSEMPLMIYKEMVKNTEN